MSKNNFAEILTEAARALKAGKAVVYPTDTCYGLGAIALSQKAVAKIYKIKERGFDKPVHVLVPSVSAAKKLVQWNGAAQKLAKKYWPGPLSMAMPLKMSANEKNGGKTNLSAKISIAALEKICAGTGYLGLRVPKNKFALALAKKVGEPITATSANPSARLSGGFDAYCPEDAMRQFKNKKHKPDLIIDAGQLPEVKPSTFVRVSKNGKKYKLEILRRGPVKISSS